MEIKRPLTVKALQEYLATQPDNALVFTEDRDFYRHRIDEVYITTDEERGDDIIAPEHAYDSDNVIISFR